MREGPPAGEPQKLYLCFSSECLPIGRVPVPFWPDDEQLGEMQIAQPAECQRPHASSSTARAKISAPSIEEGERLTPTNFRSSPAIPAREHLLRGGAPTPSSPIPRAPSSFISLSGKSTKRTSMGGTSAF